MNAPLHVVRYPQPPVSLLVVREDVVACPERASDWTQVHERIVALGIERAKHERELCRWLLAAERLGVAARTGHASLHEYAERHAGLRNRRETEERLRVGRALAELPVLDGAFAQGQLCWSAVRELTRIARPETEQAWRDWARGKKSRQIEKAVASRSAGELPGDRPDPSRIKHRLSFEVRAETMALLRDLQAAVRADLGMTAAEMDDDALLYEIARRALGGPDEEGCASYQVAVTRCPSCKHTGIDAGGERHAIDDAATEMVACDSQQLGDVDAIPHVGADGSETETDPERKRKRATQTIPPAVRRQVLRRDGKCCLVDGCNNHRFLDVHHVRPRNEGGGHDPELLATLCGSHHLAVHRGTLCIDGTASTGFSFRHADGTAYGEALRAPAVDVAEQAFDALRALGFKQTQARQLIDIVQRGGAPEALDEFLRAALRAS